MDLHNMCEKKCIGEKIYVEMIKETEPVNEREKML